MDKVTATTANIPRIFDSSNVAVTVIRSMILKTTQHWLAGWLAGWPAKTALLIGDYLGTLSLLAVQRDWIF